MKQLIEFLMESISEMNGYIQSPDYDDLEKHDSAVAKEAYSRVLDFVKRRIDTNLNNRDSNTEYKVRLECWDYPYKSSTPPRVTYLERIFHSEEDAETEALLDALKFAEELNFGTDETDFNEMPEEQRLLFRVDLEVEDCVAVVRAWDGDDYWDIQKYQIVIVHDGNEIVVGEL